MVLPVNSPHLPGDPDPLPLVSVVVVTYQHAAFIGSCIEKILAQRCDFRYEILIGEDQSTDGTREICERLAADHPDKITLFLRDRKDVMVIMGKPTGRANLMDLLQKARGKYVALCEGDDHWIDPDKLQTQVDALEREPRLCGCFTNAYNEQDGLRSEYYGAPGVPLPPAELVLEDVIENVSMPTCTLVFRRALILPLDPAFREAPVADSVLLTVLARQGPLRFIDRHTGVRHVHPGGIYSMTSELYRLEVSLALAPFMDRLSDGRFKERFAQRRSHLLQRIWEVSLRAGNKARARSAWWALLKDRHRTGWSLRDVAWTFARTWGIKR